MVIRGDDFESLRKVLRARLRDHGDAAAIELGAAQVRLLLDEAGRLQQSNERLRRQNRRMRLKLQRAGIDEPGDDAAGPTDAEGAP